MTGKKHKILMVEDDKFINRAYKDSLEHAGFEVFSANNGREAMESLKKDKPNLIVLDLIMPDMDGFEFLEEIKAEKKYKKIPVMILSNLGQDEDVSRGIALGAVEYLIKINYSISEVLQKIKYHIAKSQVDTHNR